MCFRLLAAAAAMAMLGACNTIPPQAGSLDAGFGEAARYNAAVQVIDPEPVYAATDAQPGDHGEKAANAAKRYRTDAVKDTQPASAKSGVGGSSGGGSGPR